MNESPSNCPACGAALPANAPQGLCPKCLLLGVAAPTEPGEGSPSQRPPPPSRESVAAAFPQLEILELIGQGGMGCVFKARQPQLNRVVALKILPEALSRDAAFATRFTREAQALAAMNHPNIVTIHDFGQAGGFFYLLMEFVDGVNLRQALRAGRFTPEQALVIVPPLCEALQFAHDRGIVHRDIKPENLLLDRAGHVKIADFGIAKMLGAETSSIGVAETQPAGTPGYMAPEQRSAPRTVDSRADIYSLGVVFYEMLTGELPEGKLQPPSSRVHGMQIDVRLDEIVLRALETTPELRYQTAAELRTQVERVTQHVPSPGVEVASTALPATNPAPRPRALLWTVGVLGVVVLIAAVLLALYLPWVRRPHENIKVAKGIVIQFESVTNFDNRSIVASASADLLPGERILARVRRGNARPEETLVTQNISLRGTQERQTVSLFWPLRSTDVALAESADAQARRFQNVAALNLAEGQWTRVFAVTNEAGIPLEAEACFQRTFLSNETATAEIWLKPGSWNMMFFRHRLPEGTMLVATGTSRGSANDYSSIHMSVSGPEMDGHATWNWLTPGAANMVASMELVRRRLEQLQAEGPIRLRPGERKEIYSITNAPGDVFSAALELRSTPPPSAAR